MTSRKHTHVGHCQACAKVHAVNVKTGAIAKHGYTTRFGFFSGTCGGSDRAALETSRKYADEIVVALRAFAAKESTRAADLRAGRLTLDTVKSGKYETRDGKYVRDRDGMRVPVMVSWADASVDARTVAVDNAARLAFANAEGAKVHAAELEKIIPVVHGSPLTPVKRVDVVADAPLAVGDTVHLFGKGGFEAVCVAIVDEVARGCGPYLNGRNVPHMVYDHPRGGRYTTPVCRIRKAAIVKRAGN